MPKQSRARAGRERSPRGFTLVELLIVVVIIGILAAIAIPQFADAKGQAYRGSVKSDLRNLATAQEEYFAESRAYASSLTDLKDKTNYQTSEGVTVTVRSGDAGGWSATADHRRLPGSDDCGVHYGNASSPASELSSPPGSTTLGVVFCVD